MAIAPGLIEPIVDLLKKPAVQQSLTALLDDIVDLEWHPETPTADALTRIILAQRINFHNPVTGGTLHAVTAQQAGMLAALVEYGAPRAGHPPARIIAGLSGESRCDFNAINPNNQDAVPGETPAQALMHMDVGAAQFDIRTMAGGEEPFADLKNVAPADIQQLALQIVWTLPRYYRFVQRLIDRAAALFAGDASIAGGVPNGDPLVLAYDAYHSGLTGAFKKAKTLGLAANWSYGLGWLHREQQYTEVLTGATARPGV